MGVSIDFLFILLYNLTGTDNRITKIIHINEIFDGT